MASEATVRRYWAVAETLVATKELSAAVCVLDALLQKTVSASLVELEIRTRIRIAEIVLTDTSQHPELARRSLEPSLQHLSHFSISDACRVEALKLLGVCHRRKHQYTTSEEFLKRAVDLSSSLDDKALHASVLLEISRTRYSRLTESNFTDRNAAKELVAVCSVYPQLAAVAETSAVALTLCICQFYGLICDSRMSEASVHLQSATALFGPITELGIMKALIDHLFTEAGHGAIQQSFLTEVELTTKKRPRCDPSMELGVTWLSEGSLNVLDQFLAVLRAAGSGATATAPGVGPLPATDRFAQLVANVEDQMRQLTHMKKQSIVLQHQSVTLNSELRFLVSVKIVAFIEMISQDLTKFNLCGAVAKVEALIQYCLLFQKHTVHFDSHVHITCALLLMNVSCGVGEDGPGHPFFDAAMSHLTAAGQSKSPHDEILVHLLKCVMLWNALQRTSSQSTSSVVAIRSDALNQIKLQLDDLKVSAGDTKSSQLWTPRHRSLLMLLSGALLIEEYDYPGAIASLKSAADTARKCLGMMSPVLTASLRLLAVAHSLAGVSDASDVAISTAMQLCTKCRDECGLAQCALWTLGRFVVACEGDNKRRDSLLRTLSLTTELVSIQTMQATSMEELKAIASFVPSGSPRYSQWQSKQANERKH